MAPEKPGKYVQKLNPMILVQSSSTATRITQVLVNCGEQGGRSQSEEGMGGVSIIEWNFLRIVRSAIDAILGATCDEFYFSL